jgi:hypothetical protein
VRWCRIVVRRGEVETENEVAGNFSPATPFRNLETATACSMSVKSRKTSLHFSRHHFRIIENNEFINIERGRRYS